MNLKETFQKQGGVELIKQYARAGVLSTALNQLIVLGKSRTALEILRLSTHLKTKQKLEKQYKESLDVLDKSYDITLPHISSKKVWICWFQGIENAPRLVQKCYESVKRNLVDREVVLITEKNMYEYVRFPEFIQTKIERGYIKGAHLSDLLRLELLIQYGGTWLDSTVFCSGGTIPDYMLDSELFMFQCLKPGRDGHATSISNWYITSNTNNRLLFLVRGLLYEYWKINDKLVDYFVFHIFFQICIERYPEEWGKVVPFSNEIPHILLLRLGEPCDENVLKAVYEMSPFHKLSYKNLQEGIEQKTGTYYERILR